VALYLLDTDTCIAVLRGPGEALRQKLLRTPIEQQTISAITLAELRFGVQISAKPRQNLLALEAFLQHLSILDWPAEAAKDYAEIRAYLQKKGKMIGSNDLLIAAHARYLRAVLVTNNEDEFRRVPGLKIDNWL
jgi:tRNA(fMet)-specific endonuclease VapC